ncbi:MAG: hypothetical protein HC927_12125 [Deltaproteobacteria bacterium]|nr:hypothetical protein [Deltaproteobacteria bacterium]
MAHFSHNIGPIHIEWGWFNKSTIVQKIGFHNHFGSTPAVVVTPHWGSGGVGHAETIENVTTSGFGVHSGNRAHNYYVQWIAIGFKAGGGLVADSTDEVLPKEMLEALEAFGGLDRSGDPDAPADTDE